MNDAEPLRTMENYESALKEIETYFMHVPALGTKATARFELLSALIECFEDAHFPIGNGPARRAPPT